MREIFFTKNGKYLGTAFTDPGHSYFPTVGLHSTGEEVRLNFGSDPNVPFVFNLEDMLREQREKLFALRMPDRTGMFFDMYRAVQPRLVTEFVYRHAVNHDDALVYMSMEASGNEMDFSGDVIRVTQR